MNDIDRFPISFAISYAHEDKEKVEPIVNILKEKYGYKNDLFYAPNKEHTLIGQDGERTFKNFFLKSKQVLVFISKYYVQKEWTRFEWDIIRRRDEVNRYIPIRLDDTPILGLPSNILCIDFEKLSKEEIAKLAIRMLKEFEKNCGLKTKNEYEKTVLEIKPSDFLTVKESVKKTHDRAKVQPVIIPTKKTIQFIRKLGQFSLGFDAKEKNIDALFGFLQDADFTTGDIPPDDIDSLKLFKSWFYKHFRRNRQIEYYSSLPPADINKHLCSIEGPVDQLFTRYGMNYDRNGHNWEPILPYIYPIKDAQEKSTTILREWKGIRWKELNWYIADCYGKPKFIPGVDENGIRLCLKSTPPQPFFERVSSDYK
ncbi:MAG: toll/interleukin-1 receptor domain-containing protein [Candidatus Thermoplasmatota archaeon]|nr:toll/interleukin-1 receptor domain-containing protein [Candidatus Thermoplasmatota archaeon]